MDDLTKVQEYSPGSHRDIKFVLKQLVGIQKRMAACMVWNNKADLQEFGRIYAAQNPIDQKRIRHEIDSNLVFSTQSHIDFLYIMEALETKFPALFAECMPHCGKRKVENIIDQPMSSWENCGDCGKRQSEDSVPSSSSSAMPAPYHREKRYYALLTDVDDTLLPSSDALNLGGCDESWRKDGTLYPGLAELHRILRGKNYPNNEPGSRGYSTCLTARPVSFIHNLKTKFPRLGRRLSILPGAIYDNMTRDDKIRYQNYANHKLRQFQKYMRIFTDEHFIFFGDNGQGDVVAAEHMLKYRAVAFCCIHIVEYTSDEGDLAQGKVMKRVTVNPNNLHRERLFFYHNIDELAYLLQSSGWITYEECIRVHNAYVRDIESEEAYWCIRERDAISLETLITIRNQDEDEEMDDWEREQVEIAEKILPLIQTQQCSPIYIDTVIVRGDLVLSIQVVKFVKNVRDKQLKTRSLRATLAKLAWKALTHRIIIKVTLCRGSHELFVLGKASSKGTDPDNVYWFSKGPDKVLMARAASFRRADRFSISVTREQLGYWTEIRTGCNTVPVLPMLEAREYLGRLKEERFTWNVYSPKVSAGKEEDMIKGELVVDIAWRTKEEVNELLEDSRVESTLL